MLRVRLEFVHVLRSIAVADDQDVHFFMDVAIVHQGNDFRSGGATFNAHHRRIGRIDNRGEHFLEHEILVPSAECKLNRTLREGNAHAFMKSFPYPFACFRRCLPLVEHRGIAPGVKQHPAAEIERAHQELAEIQRVYEVHHTSRPYAFLKDLVERDAFLTPRPDVVIIHPHCFVDEISIEIDLRGGGDCEHDEQQE